MKKNSCIQFFLILLLATTQRASGQGASPYIIPSPNRSTVWQMGTEGDGQLVYLVLRAGREVIAWSRLGFNQRGSGWESIQMPVRPVTPGNNA